MNEVFDFIKKCGTYYLDSRERTAEKPTIRNNQHFVKQVLHPDRKNLG